jgi:hypothetical protein
LQSDRDFPAGDLFCKEKCGGLNPQAVDQRRARSMVDQGQGLGGGSSELSLVASPVSVAHRGRGKTEPAMRRNREATRWSLDDGEMAVQ